MKSTYEPEILNAFRRILQALRLAAAQTHAQAGISAAQLFLLSQLDQAGPLSISELAQASMTDRSSVADVVDRLVQTGLVRRTPSTEDRRRAEVRLTPAGRALMRKAPAPPTSLLLNGLARMKERDIRALATGLTRLCEELGLQHEKPAMLFEPPRATGQLRRTRSKN